MSYHYGHVLPMVSRKQNAFAGRAPPEKASELSDAPVSLPEVG